MAPSTHIIGRDSNHERYFFIRTESPRFIAEFVEPGEADDGLILEDGRGLVPGADGVPVEVEQWIDPRPPEAEIQAILTEIRPTVLAIT